MAKSGRPGPGWKRGARERIFLAMSATERWSEEKQSAWIYRAIADREPDARQAELFRGLARAADEQARILETDIVAAGAPVPAFAPALRARLVAAYARRFGPRHARGMLAALKVRGLSAYGGGLPDEPEGHVMPETTGEIGARHRRPGGGGSLRAAVFGVNDGLVSNACLVFGVAGAAAQSSTILTTGIAGLLAGAFSMAAGEYVSVRSQRELYENQIGEEREELERYPEAEAEELALIYQARGVPLEQARALTHRMVKDKERMLDTLAREELGLDPSQLGSPWSAALASFAAFTLGAFVPLLPFLGRSPEAPLAATAALSAAALFAIGALVSLFSGKNALVGGLRMLAIGAAAGVVTFAIGKWIGAGIAG